MDITELPSVLPSIILKKAINMSNTVYIFNTNVKTNVFLLSQALMALFVLASKDGWVSIMYTGLDAVGVDQQVSMLVNV